MSNFDQLDPDVSKCLDGISVKANRRLIRYTKFYQSSIVIVLLILILGNK